MQLEQPHSALQRGQPAALNAICARRTLLRIAQVVQKAIMVSNPPEIWRMSANLRRPIIASERVDRTGVGVAPDRRVWPDILARGLNSGFATFCLLIVSLLPLDAAAQITEALLPYPVAPRTPQERPSEFAPIGARLGDFFWFPRAELDEAYNSNIFATATRPTYDFITALTPSFDLLSNFPRNSLNLRAGSLLQVYADHPAQNTQDGVVTADGRLDVTAGSYLYGTVLAGHQHISYGSPNSPGNIAQPVTYWDYAATAGYAQGGRRFSYAVDVGVSAAQFNAAQLVGGGVLPQSTQDGQPRPRRLLGATKLFQIIWAMSAWAAVCSTIGIRRPPLPASRKRARTFRHIGLTSACKSFLGTSFQGQLTSDI